MATSRPFTLAALAVTLIAAVLGGSGPARAASRPEAKTKQSDFNGDGDADMAVGVPSEDVGGAVNAGAVNVIYGTAKGLDSQGDQFFRQGGSTGILGDPGSGDQFGYSVAAGDFNRDGFADLAVGVPGDEVSGHPAAGAVNVIYGSAGGLTAVGNQLWSQDSPGVEGDAANNDSFGLSVAAGDLDHDGFADLAIGVPGETVGNRGNAGGVSVLYGSASGLTSSGNQLWTQDSAGIANAAEAGDNFGFSVAVGDWGGDASADLAAGVPLEDPPTDAGAVAVIYGSSGSGLTSGGNQLWSQDSPGIADSGESEDLFGFSLAQGDINGDGKADLAVGVPGEDVSSKLDAGAVNVIFGSGAGLTSSGNQYWNQNSPDIVNASEPGDEFGLSLAVGDFDGNGFGDLAAGVPFEDPPTDSGCVNVIYGTAAGLTSTGNQLWSQDSTGILGDSQQQDAFGGAVATSDLDGDGFTDLAIGVPQKSVGGQAAAGSVSVLYGSQGKLGSNRNQVWNQDTPGINDRADIADFFGGALASGAPTISARSLPAGRALRP